MSTISLNVVVKNEESNILKMMASLQHLVKEMVVVDTGSTDATIETIQRFRVERFPNLKLIQMSIDKWTGPLCVKARQAALDASTHPWVLVIDGDEELSRSLDSEIRSFVNHPGSYDCMKIRRVNFLENRPNHYDSIMRLFLRAPGYQWFVGGEERWFEEISLISNGVKRNAHLTSKGELYHFGWYKLPVEVLEMKRERYAKVGYPPYVEKQI